MKKNNYYQKGEVGAGFIFAAVILFVLGYFYFYPSSFQEYVPSDDNQNQFCRPYVEEDGSIRPDAPEIMAPLYEYVQDMYEPQVKNTLVPYRLIKASVPITVRYLKNYYSKDLLRDGKSINDIRCEPPGQEGQGAKLHNHFCQWVHEGLQIKSNLSESPQYSVLFPASYTINGPAFSNPFNEGSMNTRFYFSNYNVIFLVHLDKVGNFNNPSNDPLRVNYPLVDIYQQVSEDNHSKPLKVLPKNVMECFDNSADKGVMTLGPVMEKSPDKKQEQLGWFVPQVSGSLSGWWHPSCKPAVYLYPEKDTLVNVKIAIPNGFLTYTDPLYPKVGWNVLAKPSGQLQYLGNAFADSKGEINYPTGIFPYLYYEGKIADSAAPKPEKGYVIAYEELETFYENILPKLGLNTKESKEFKEYWLKALPKSPYYFIGLIPEEELDRNEPLTITPKEDTLIRVRLYFEALDQLKTVAEPEIMTPTRTGFTVVDWGGMVKNDKNHPFTCVQ